MLRRVRDFGAENAADFPAASIGGQGFANIAAAVADLETASGERAESQGESSQSTQRKANVREELREDLRAIAMTARSIAVDTDSEIDEQFRLPRNNSDAELLATARGFALAAFPHEAEFVSFGLPVEFLTDLNADIIAYEEMITAGNAARSAGVAATAAIDEAIEKGMTALRRIEAVVRNKYSNNAEKLAAWTSAAHVERAPRAPKPPTPPQQ
jgi:hypothetical protein